MRGRDDNGIYGGLLPSARSLRVFSDRTGLAGIYNVAAPARAISMMNTELIRRLDQWLLIRRAMNEGQPSTEQHIIQLCKDELLAALTRDAAGFKLTAELCALTEDKNERISRPQAMVLVVEWRMAIDATRKGKA